MPQKKNKQTKDRRDRGDQSAMTPQCLRYSLKLIGNLSRTGMEAGNMGDFEKAFLNMEDAFSLAKDLNRKCLEAKLLNNFGLLYTMSGSWDQALLMYEQSMDVVTGYFGTDNSLYKALQKNIGYILNLDVSTGGHPEPAG